MSDNATTTSTDLQPIITGRAATTDRLWAALEAHPSSTTEQLAAHSGVGQSTAGKILARWVSEATVTRRTTTGTGKGRGPATFTIAASADSVLDPSDARAEDNEPARDDVATDSTGPAPSDPAPSDPAPSDPAPSDPAPSDPAPSDPAPSDPAPSDPAPSDPAPSDPAPSDPAPSDPAPSDPAPRDDTNTEKVARLAPGGLRGMVEDYLRDHPADDLGPAKIGTELGRSSGAVANALDRLVKDGYAQMTSPKPKRYRLAPAAPSGD